MNETTETKPQRSRAAKWTRRGVIGAGVLAGGALVIGVAVRTGNPVGKLKPIVAPGQDEALVNSWVKINADNIVTAIVPHCEMGQGANSTIAQMLADEMDVSWDNVRVMDAPADGNYVSQHAARMFVGPGTLPDKPNQVGFMEPTYDGLFTQVAKLASAYITGGSSSVRSTGQNGMRIAGAAAREMLIAAAASEWGVPTGEIATSDGMLTHASSGKTATYASLAAAAAEQDLPRAPRIKTADEYKLMGTAAPRKDIPSKVDGTAIFGVDGGPDGEDLRYAAVKAPPVVGSSVASMDASNAKRMGGVLQILNMGDFVAVVADSYWQAQQALNTIETTYTKTEIDHLDSEQMFANYTAALDEAGDSGGKSKANYGDAADALINAAKTVEAEYRVPFLAHATMEPMNCTAWVRDGKCDIWTGTQVPLMSRDGAAEGAGVSADDVTMHTVFLGGGFGRRLTPEYANQAARLAKATGYPIKMIWSREEDTAQDFYRPADISRFSGGLEENGKLVSWNNIHCTDDEPAEAPLVEFYDIPNVAIRGAEVEPPLRLGAWRSVAHSQHGFFVESFVDELAHEAGKDPVEFRRELLANSPRHLAVLNGAAEMADWGSELPEGHGRGIAIARSFGSIVAEVAEVDMTDDKPRVVKMYCCVDAGFAMNPDGLTAQMESGIVYGLTAALYDEITIKNGAVEQSNFHDYHMMRMDDAPEIAVQIINGAPDNLGGAGEPGLPPAAAAVTNAIFAANGQRIRELPIAKHFA
ncbi:molybdopterin-dependent oxidoreductase [Pontixanthobacter aestiaquae]|uniref:Molybdopterin-dependent oxidoreductase n=1 Tax=Pontixanthobacter aestiaquae TaxID=1509367 RepID=A0A844Z3X4_9SPHN|nr:molybdopterin cofactor-binding domain-containing protein [Pontixanthobacter aestiaquae]MDN3647227.1 molybdopterin-dependent oxidoreductase [Pontixanthobacter aestiaquae]MXO81797.1 molybdopterin-dependent oxidoreductase [Pontixanthobacter aestiaquae]